MVFSTSKIAKVFHKDYSTLYSINQTRVQEKEKREKIKDYLNKVKLPNITEDKLKRLEKSISEEINSALKGAPFGKTPWPDGFTSRYYKIFKERLITKMCSYMNGLETHLEMRKEALLASITVIPKEGKYVTLCSSYRPIALLNTDIC